MRKAKKRSKESMVVILPDNRLSLARSREILTSTGISYTDEEIIKIRDFLYLFAEWAIEHCDNENEDRPQAIRA